MLAARDQENLVHGLHQAAASKPLNQSTRGLQPKTPGNKYPKTPLKVPLNDENAPTAFGGKTGKGKGLESFAAGGKKSAVPDNNAFITPMGPRTRAPLGMKTTNAKATAFQTSGPLLERDLEKTQTKQASTRRPKKVIHADSVKLEVHGDESPLAEREIEYCPPKPKDLPYESDVFPSNCLNTQYLKNGNLMRGIYKTYHDTVDENGLSRLEREYEAAYQKLAKDGEERILKMMEEEWTIGDVPETFRHLRKKQSPMQESKPQQPKSTVTTKGPATIALRKAASALSVAPKSAPLQPKATKAAPKPSFLSRPKPALFPIASTASTMRHAAATATSRSTIGYTKGRSASDALHSQQGARKTALGAKKVGGLTRSVSNMSHSSDVTITPARFAQEREQELEYRNPSFLKAFEVDDDELEPGLRGALPECLRRPDNDDDEEFVMTLGTGESS